MFLMVGLGNPEEKHAGNRHNIGFVAIDRIAKSFNFPAFRSRFKGLLSEGKISGHPIKLLKPATYMNNSGEAIGETMRFFKLTPSQVYVFYDDLDLQPGKCRIRLGGGTGGHNGLRSIQKHIGQNYWRIRLGIGHPGNKELVLSYVLRDFSETEQTDWLAKLLDTLAENIDFLIQGDENALMSKLALELSSTPNEDTPPNNTPNTNL